VLLSARRTWLAWPARAWWEAALKNGAWTDWKVALVPDDYDDLIARRGGHISADFTASP